MSSYSCSRYCPLVFIHISLFNNRPEEPTAAPTVAPTITISPTGLCIEGQDGPGSGGTSCTTDSDCCHYTASNKKLICTLQTGDPNDPPGGAMKCE